MKSLLFTILFSLQVTISLAAQDSLVFSGVVKDTATGKYIQYVNIGIRGRSLGTVSNDKGEFTIKIPFRYQNTDSLTFSCIGYEKKEIKLSGLSVQDKNIILLKPKVVQLDEVKIISKKVKSKVKGNVSRKSSIVLGISSSLNLGMELGTVIRLPDKPVFLKDFNFHIVYNRPDSAKFRLNIYKFNKKIGENILSVPIYFTVKNDDTGDYTLNLRKYNINVINDIFVSIEVVAVYSSKGPDTKIRNDKYFFDRINISGTLIGSPSYKRKVSLDKWENFGSTFSPGFWMTVAY